MKDLGLIPFSDALATLPAGASALVYPPPGGLPIIPRQRNLDEPAIVGWPDCKEWRWPFAGSKTDLYFQELFT
jgi:hypothetical protein